MNRKYEQAISLEGLMKDVKQIAQWERLAGSEEEAKAFDYLEQRLKDMGYITNLIRHDAYISIPITSRFLAAGKQIKSQTHSMSADTGGAALTGQLIYLENLHKVPSGTDCREKIILTRGRAVYTTVHLAELLGAVAVVYMQEEPVRECIPSAAWGSPVLEQKNLLPRIPVLSVREQDGNRILEQMKREVVMAEVETKLETGWKKIPLLTGEIKSLIKSSQFVMFSGHVDSWYYGAIDNGTANAVQLETARLVALSREKLKRNFRVVFFSGHSQGRYAGSAWYADSAWKDLHENCVVNINADSLGGKGASDITRSVIMPETKGLAAEIIKKQTGVEFTGSRCQRSADQSFWPAGVSSAFASFSKQAGVKKADDAWIYEPGNSELGWWWHTPEDTPDNVEPQNLARDAGIFAEYTCQFLTSRLLPMDYTETLKEINHELKRWQEKAQDRVDLQDAIRIAETLIISCSGFYSCDISPELKNSVIFKLGRILVPLNYTTGNAYENDPAVSLPPVPSLAVIDTLLSLNESEDQYKEWMIVFLRKKNFVMDSLLKVQALLDSSGLGSK